MIRKVVNAATASSRINCVTSLAFTVNEVENGIRNTLILVDLDPNIKAITTVETQNTCAVNLVANEIYLMAVIDIVNTALSTTTLFTNLKLNTNALKSALLQTAVHLVLLIWNTLFQILPKHTTAARNAA